MRFNENNQVRMAGEIGSDFQFSHEAYGEKFYLFDLKIERLSKTVDVLPILISERLVNVKESGKGALVEVEGELRSFNKHVGERSHLILTVFATRIEEVDMTMGLNEVVLRGFLCKKPNYRDTPSGRDITDFSLAINRQYRQSDYIPCIAWGRNAIFMGMQEVGTEVIVYGRFQSREYNKRLENGETEVRTAFELSVHKLEVVNDKCEY